MTPPKDKKKEEEKDYSGFCKRCGKYDEWQKPDDFCIECRRELNKIEYDKKQ